VEPNIEPPELPSVEEALRWVGESGDFLSEPIIYRGQSQASWSLLPSLLRKPKVASRYGGFEKLEEEVLKKFRSFSHPYLENNKPDSELEWMALAQHHGCPTRLLDWTGNPLVALFFATERDDQCKAVVWCYRNFNWYNEESYKGLNDRIIWYLSLRTRIVAYLPKHISPRIVAQTGCFTRHSSYQPIFEIHSKEPEEPRDLGVMHMEEEIASFTEEYCANILAWLPPIGPPNAFDAFSVSEKLKWIPRAGSLSKAVIPAERKKYIRRQLDKLNINRASLFPGLDGISDYINQTLDRSIEKD
jgi:FRG domain-containing protein